MSETRNSGLELLIGGLLCFGGGYHFGKKKGYDEGYSDGYDEASDEATRILLMGSMRKEKEEPSYVGRHARRK